MKQKYTKAKKARRASGFRHIGTNGTPSKERLAKRLALQPKATKPRGYQILSIQRISCGKDQFGNRRAKYIHHPRYAKQGYSNAEAGA